MRHVPCNAIPPTCQLPVSENSAFTLLKTNTGNGKDPRSQASGGLDAVNTDMHNRVRMVVGSFLSENLGIPWRLCEEWFWDTLVDADAAPFFRIFNPETQAKRFVPDGDYVRHWVPALSAPPIMDLKESRQAAPDAYE